jgi:hypothetical protein
VYLFSVALMSVNEYVLQLMGQQPHAAQALGARAAAAAGGCRHGASRVD